MDITISGRNTVVTEELKVACREKLAKLDRFADGRARVEVDFIQHRNPRIHDDHEVEVLVHLKRHLVKATAASTDHFVALDLVVDKVEHQVRKLKERRIGRSRPRQGRAVGPAPEPASARPGAPDDAPGALDGVSATDDGTTGFDDGNGPDDWSDQPVQLVKVKSIRIKPMTTEEAALQMDLLEHDFFFFTNAESGRPAVVYRRHDGDLGLLEADA